MFDHLLSYQVLQRAGLEAMWLIQTSKTTAKLFSKDLLLPFCYCSWHLLSLLRPGALERTPADPLAHESLPNQVLCNCPPSTCKGSQENKAPALRGVLTAYRMHQRESAWCWRKIWVLICLGWMMYAYHRQKNGWPNPQTPKDLSWEVGDWQVFCGLQSRTRSGLSSFSSAMDRVICIKFCLFSLSFCFWMSGWMSTECSGWLMENTVPIMTGNDTVFSSITWMASKGMECRLPG